MANAGTGARASRRPGHVWLVGAGPGDPGLITVRGAELLAAADVVVTDQLAGSDLLDRTRPDAEIVHVGRTRSARARTQAEINALLVDRARAGALVVRLKGGDPFLLGRGGEEAEACAAAGVGATVVPGVTSALAAPAYAGIPVTHRGLAQDLVIVSGHLPPYHPASGVDWSTLGASSLTVVVLMGVAHLMAIADALLAAGRPADTPAAVIEQATTPAQRVLRTTLGSLGVDAVATAVRSPAVIVVGAVAARQDAPGAASAAGRPSFRGLPAAGSGGSEGSNGSEGSGGSEGSNGRRSGTGRLAATTGDGGGDGGDGGGRVRAGSSDAARSGAGWPGGAPAGREPARGAVPADDRDGLGRSAAGSLRGVRVLVPRTRERQGLLARGLEQLGAQVVETVVSRLAPVPDADALLSALPGADALVLADAEEVEAVVLLLRRSGRDVRALAGLTLVAATETAATAFAALGLASVRSSTEVRVAHVVVTDIPVTGLRVAVCAAAAPPVGIRTVRRIKLLDDTLSEADELVRVGLSRGDFGVVAFASSTAARATGELYGPLPDGLLVAAMGRRTVAACRTAGIRVDAIAAEPGIVGLVAAVRQLGADPLRGDARPG